MYILKIDEYYVPIGFDGIAFVEPSFNIRAYDFEGDKNTEFSMFILPEDYDEIAKPGITAQYETSFITGEPMLVAFGWCAVGEETLDTNWSSLTHEIFIDDVSIDLSKLPLGIITEGDLICRRYLGVLTGWSSGYHSLTLIYHIDQAINDGLYTYEAGKYIIEFAVDID